MARKRTFSETAIRALSTSRALCNFAPTTFAVLPSEPPPGPFQSSITLSGTKPSTASAMSVSQEPRRSSPSLKMSRPSCHCLFESGGYGPILLGPKRFRREPALRISGTGLQQFKRAKETSDLLGSI